MAGRSSQRATNPRHILASVGFADLLIVAQNYGHSLAAPAAAAASAGSASLLLRKIRPSR